MTQPATEPPVLTADGVRDALRAASVWLLANAERVNALNVFPVPDGDTGTNMSLTLKAAADAVAELPVGASVVDIGQTAARAGLMGARGNSGVILSQLLRGFFSVLASGEINHTPNLARAFAEASRAAYAGVSRPVEGTILTVAREAAQAAQVAADSGADWRGLFEQAQQAAAVAVANTPNQLEVLRQAGVVDSGGEGLRVLLEGVCLWANGQSVEEAAEQMSGAVVHANVEAIAHEDDAFGFCTEFLLQGCQEPLPAVKAAMEALGQSVIAVGDADLLRVHVHTLRPGLALEYAVDHGIVMRVKVENMELQREAFAASGSAVGHADEGAAAVVDTGVAVVAVSPGEGFSSVFRSLGATTLPGGQTMNPSVREIVDAVQALSAAEVILLPNNGNVVLTARQVPDLVSRRVHVIPTTTVPQGIAALLAYNFEQDAKSNVAAMTPATEAVRTVEVAEAVRDTEVNGLAVQAGQQLGLLDGEVVAVEASPDRAALQALEGANLGSAEIVTIYFGKDATEADAQLLAEQVRERHAGLAVEVVPGGQPHYPFVISVE